MSRVRDIVFLSTNHWSGLPTSKQHLARVLARSRRVLFVEPPIDVFSALGRPERWRKLLGRSRALPNLTVLSSVVARSSSDPDARLAFHERWVRGVDRTRRALGLDAPIVWAFGPEHLAYAGRLGEALFVYHAADEPASMSPRPERTREIERELMDRADLVFVASQALLDERVYTGKAVRLPNAADVRHFARIIVGDEEAPPASFLNALGRPASVPHPLRAARRPVVMYGGAAYRWFDDELFLELSRSRPLWSFLLVGPLGKELKRSVLPSNVIAVGRRTYEEFPRYVAASDAAIIPWRDGLFSQNADPIVLYEYLLCGKPVVATPFPAALERGSLVSTATSAEGFAAALEDALAKAPDAGERLRRAEFGFANTWEKRAETALALIDRALSGPRGRKG